MKPLPKTVKESKKSNKYILFRVPRDLPLADLDGAKIDLHDLKILSGPKLAAVTDLHLNKERASACPLLPDDTDTSSQKPTKMRCGPVFEGIVQIIRKPTVQPVAANPPVQSEKKSKKKRMVEE